MSRIREFVTDDDRVLYDQVHCFSVEDQWWNTETLQEFRDKHNIIFMSSGGGCKPIMVIPRNGEAPLVAIGVEDDGTLYFKRNSHSGRYANSFDSGWIDTLIADLKAVKEAIEEDMK